MKFIFASARDKIIRYKIDDPYLKTFIRKYENLVPWNQIKSQEDINNFISGTLLPKVKEAFDPKSESNHFIKDIDLEREFERNMDNPDVQRAARLVKRDVQSAKDAIIEPINKRKKEAFELWWNYMTKENDEYAKRPAFIYMVLKPLFDSSPSDTRRPIIGHNALALANVFGDVGDDTGPINIMKAYKRALTKVESQDLEKFQTDEEDGWIRIPSAKNDPDNFDENVQKLKNLSVPRGWCTGDSMARPYLSKGDFWLLIKDKEARVAIRFEGDRIQEIQGDHNKRPFDYWEEILKLIDKKGFDKESHHYKQLLDAKLLNDRLDNDPNFIDEFKVEFLEKPETFEMLSRERQKQPEFLDLAALYWNTKIQNAELKPPNFWTSAPSLYNECPQEIKPRLDKKSLDSVYNSFINAPKSHVPVLSGLAGETKHSFFNLEPYAMAYARFLEPYVKEKPWVGALIHYKVEKFMDQEIIQKAREDQAYEAILDFETIEEGNENPGDILNNHFYDGSSGPYDDEYRFEELVDLSQEQLDEMYKKDKDPEHEDYLEDKELPDSFYDETFIDHIKSNLADYWHSYVTVDPKDRYEEVESFLRENTYLADWDDYTDCRSEWENAWNDEIYEDPTKINEAPSEIAEYLYSDYADDDDNWYVSAWVNYTLQDFDNFTEAKHYIYSERHLDYFYEKILEQVDDEILQRAIISDPDLILEEEWFKVINSHSNFIENNKAFIIRFIDQYIEEKPENIHYMLDIVEEMRDEHELYESEDDEKLVEKYEEMFRQYWIEWMQKRPYEFEKVPYHLREDPDIVKARIGTLDDWKQYLWDVSPKVYDTAPEKIRMQEEFYHEATKANIVQRLGFSDMEGLIQFDSSVERYKDDEHFYDKALANAKASYKRHVSQYWQSVGDVEKTKAIFGRVPNFVINDPELMKHTAEVICRAWMGGYRNSTPLTGKELSSVDPRLAELMIPIMQTIVNEDYRIYSYSDFYKQSQFINEAYRMYPDKFQEQYDKLKNMYFGYMNSDIERSLNFIPLVFREDREVINALREKAQELNIDLSEKEAWQDIGHQPDDNQLEFDFTYDEENKMSQSWYDRHKRKVFGQAPQLIDAMEVEGIIEGFGTRRFTIGFKKQDGSFRIMNAQRRVQRPYEGREQGDYAPVRAYMTLYDLQKASQIAKEALSDVDVNELDPALLRLAYRRVYPQSVEFIKGGGQTYIVRGSDYAIENGFIEEE